jgi:hypothetical protein
MGDHENFVKYVDYVRKYVSFNVSSTVQVFETTIRGMGGLLSAHLYASVPRLGQTIETYDGFLLAMAHDLGKRLLPAFDTESGIPHPRINLRHGVVPIGGKYITETCSSGAGSLVLEFGLLSRLTGDARFEKVARRAFFQLWTRRSKLNLIGMSIDAVSGQWLAPVTGIGASIDSFYEYAVKYYILFGEVSFYKVFDSLYNTLKQYAFDGWLFHNTNFATGTVITSWIDALAAFFPGLQVLAGDVSAAVKHHLVYYKLWNTYGGIPERWRTVTCDEPILLEWYPLRPEFIESNYYLYRATNDPFYLQVGVGVMSDIEMINKVRCGYAGIQDVRVGTLTDRMESFFLSETVKYLYLLFDKDNILNTELSNYVFSTEAHPLWYDGDVIRYASLEQFPKLATVMDILVDENPDLVVQVSNLTSRILGRITRMWSQQKESRVKSAGGNNPKCSVWANRNTDFSSVVSWGGFYDLDRMYRYQRPEWLANMNRRDWMERDHKFWDRYLRPGSTCDADTKSQMVEVYFSDEGGYFNNPTTVKGSFRGESVLMVRDLYGKRLKFQRIEDFAGGALLEVVSLDGEVIDGLLLIEKKPQVGAVFLIDDDGVVTVQGIRVTNMFVGGHTKLHLYRS